MKDPARGLRLVGATEYTMTPPGSAGDLVAPTWLLEVFTSGRIEIGIVGRAGGVEWRACAVGDGVLYAPGTHYRERIPAPCQSVYVQFDDAGGVLRPLLRRWRSLWLRDQGRTLEPLLRQCAAGMGGGVAAELGAVGAFLQALGVLLAGDVRQGVLTVAPPGADAPDLVTATHRYLRDHLAEPVRLADVADHLGLSESGLSHAYRRVTGRTPMATLRALRAEAARLRLVRGHLKLSAIAEQTGFADAFHLSRTFKRVTGKSPREFLRASRPTAST